MFLKLKEFGGTLYLLRGICFVIDGPRWTLLRVMRACIPPFIDHLFRVI